MDQVVYMPKISTGDKPIARGIFKHVRRIVEGDTRAEVPVPASTFESSCKNPAILKAYVLQELGNIYSFRLEGDTYLFSK